MKVMDVLRTLGLFFGTIALLAFLSGRTEKWSWGLGPSAVSDLGRMPSGIEKVTRHRLKQGDSPRL